MGITDSKSGTAFLTLTYGRDNDSLLTSDSGTGYGYDTLNRVTSAASTSYQYDKADQLNQMAVSGGNTTTQTYDIAGQLKTSTVSNGQTQVSKLSFSFDANGNRTRTIDQNNVNTTLGYDAANRLTNYNGSAGYAYNGDGLRMSKTVSGSTTRQTWNTAEGLPTLVQDGNLAYVTGVGGLPLEQVSGSTVYWYHDDQLGSVRALTDASGVVQQTYTFDAYGNLVSSSGSITNPFRFSGQYFDAETGLYYLRARYYDPTSAAFTGRDSLTPTTRQPYVYVSDGPLNATDPTGAFCIGVQGGANGFGGGSATGDRSAGFSSGLMAGICTNGDAFVAPGAGAFASDGRNARCWPSSCGGPVGANGLFGSCGGGLNWSWDANAAADYRGAFRHGSIGVGAGAGGDLTLDESGGKGFWSIGPVGVAGGAGATQFDTYSYVASFNWVTTFVNDPLVDAAKNVGGAWHGIFG